MYSTFLSRENKAAIVLGASKFRKSPTLNRAGFSSSAGDFVSYLLDESRFGLRGCNLLNLFDSDLAPGAQLEEMCDFLDQYLRRAADEIADIVLYYVGHGGFVGINKEYFLAIATTKEGLEGSSAIRIGDLSSALRDHAGRARKYLILDCCFAASAFSQFQSSALSNMISAQTLEPLPRSGTALLCSSGSRQVSLSPSGQHRTMFSGALLEVLGVGDPRGPFAFSLGEVGRRVKDNLKNKYPEEWIRPEVHSPDMREGDIADVPIFPNPQFNPDQPIIPIAQYVQNLESLLTARTEQLQVTTSSLERSFDITLETLGDLLEDRGTESQGHCKRVTAFTVMIARIMGASKTQTHVIARGAFLHDVGKLSIPDAIPHKPGKLTPDEIAVMREHCLYGYRTVKRIPYLNAAAEIVYSHQEWYDGTGYPRGLRGAEIPLGARMFAIADAFESLTSDRPYRPACSITKARGTIQNSAGRQFDPEIVIAFATVPDKLLLDLRTEVDQSHTVRD